MMLRTNKHSQKQAELGAHALLTEFVTRLQEIAPMAADAKEQALHEITLECEEPDSRIRALAGRIARDKINVCLKDICKLESEKVDYNSERNGRFEDCIIIVSLSNNSLARICDKLADLQKALLGTSRPSHNIKPAK